VLEQEVGISSMSWFKPPRSTLRRVAAASDRDAQGSGEDKLTQAGDDNDDPGVGVMPSFGLKRDQCNSLRAMQTKIGEILQARYAAVEPMPGRLVELLRALDEGDDAPIGAAIR
jgi:hypothetical protein